MQETEPIAAEQTAETDNLSVEQLLAGTLGESPEPTEEEGSEEETEPEETEDTEATEELAEEAEETEDEDETEEPESADDFDLDALSEEQIQELAEKARSKALSRYGKLTKRAKDAEERLAKLEETTTKPAPSPIENNPYKDLKTREEVQEKKVELEGIIDATDYLLDEHEDIGPNDLIEFQGKEFTKRDIRAANRNSRKALDKFLPAQEGTIAQAEQRQAARVHFDGVVAKDFPTFVEEGHEDADKYSQIMEDDLVKQIEKNVPQFAPQLGLVMAHYLNSVTQSLKQPTKTKVQSTGKKPRVKPPSTPGGASAQSGKRVGVEKKRALARKQFEESGTADDLVAMLSQ